MKAIFRIRIKEGKPVSGKHLTEILRDISQESSKVYMEELTLSNDLGDFYTIGLRSDSPGEDVVIGRLPEEKPEILMNEFLQEGDIAVMSWEFGGPKYAIFDRPERTKNAVLDLRNKIEDRLNSQ